MEAVRNWMSSREEPPGVEEMERRDSPTRELERPSWVREQSNPEGIGAGHSTARKRRDNITPSEGRPCSRTTRREGIRLVSAAEANRPIDKATDPRSKLYQAAKAG